MPVVGGVGTVTAGDATGTVTVSQFAPSGSPRRMREHEHPPARPPFSG